MADRDNYRGYGSPSGRYYESREYEPGYGGRDWRERGERGWSGGRDRDEDRGWFGRDRDDWRRDRGRDDDRGFFERAGDEIRSWFSDDDEDDRERGRYRERGDWAGRRERDQDRGRGYGWGSMMSGRGGRDWEDRERRYGSGGYESPGSRYGGSSGYRVGRFEDRGGYGESRWGGHPHDEHYSEWRRQQMEALDRDYDEYRRENREKFHGEFSNWRNQRQQQRSSMRNVREHMEVVGSDGEHVGTVDKVAGDRIILTKSDASAGGHHHSIPCSWIQSVDDRVTINKSAEEARRQWRDEENRRALFEDQDQRRNDGPHILNRSFSGTYEDR